MNTGCWLAQDSVQAWLNEHGLGHSEEDLIKMWAFFEEEALKKLEEVSEESPKQVYVWTSTLTLPWYVEYLAPSRFAIEIWNSARNPDSWDSKTIKAVAEKGYKMVFSNEEQTYLDLGYLGWNYQRQLSTVYEDNPYKILERHGVNNFEEAESNVLGGEIALWTEITDDSTLVMMMEPRTAAYGEMLWRDPRHSSSWAEASYRMLRHRERLQERGVQAETITNG